MSLPSFYKQVTIHKLIHFEIPAKQWENYNLKYKYAIYSRIRNIKWNPKNKSKKDVQDVSQLRITKTLLKKNEWEDLFYWILRFPLKLQ